MIKKLLALTCLTLSISAHAAIVDLGQHTRDTSTGLDWLDFEQTSELSSFGMASALDAGGALEIYRYATWNEILTLWSNLGVPVYEGIECPCWSGYASRAYTSQEFDAFMSGADLLGMPVTAEAGVFEFKGRSSLSRIDLLRFDTGSGNLEFYELFNGPSWAANPGVGNYLVTQSPVPAPAAFWLFGSALVTLGTIRRKNN